MMLWEQRMPRSECIPLGMSHCQDSAVAPLGVPWGTSQRPFHTSGCCSGVLGPSLHALLPLSSPRFLWCHISGELPSTLRCFGVRGRIWGGSPSLTPSLSIPPAAGGWGRVSVTLR